MCGNISAIIALIAIKQTHLKFFFSCSKTKEIAEFNENSLQQNQEINLPDDFTTDKILDATSDKSFDNYIDKAIDVEIRVYRDGSDRTVYAHTSIGQ